MNRLASVALAPLGGLYGVAMKARQGLYRRGLFHVQDVGVPVISVGNLTMGGTGKTPLVEWIAARLAAKNRRVCILTRGYGRANPKQRVIVSNGVEILADADRAGDEAFLLAEKLKGRAAVISDADRASAARWAIQHLGSNVFVLDDGFQNLGLTRQLDIVTIDATNPWGNRRLLPAGILRERPDELARADCIVLTRVGDSQRILELEREVNELSKGRPVFRSRMKILGLRPVRGEREKLSGEEIKAANAAAFCAIGNPESFFSQMRSEGYQLNHTQAFRDHHVYTQTDIDRVVRSSLDAGARVLLTTAKDEVKLRLLRFELPC
ncbi:MAG: tetraacyldisaccharide 4'-kinase, partial [Acidobacteriota bacterium]